MSESHQGYCVARIALQLDLSPFCAWMDRERIAHRIVRTGQHQELWLDHAEDAQRVRMALEEYAAAVADALQKRAIWQASPGQAPWVIAVLLIAALLAWMTGFSRHGPLELLTIVDTSGWLVDDAARRMDVLMATLTAGQWWRLITPDFLHFDISHLLFNAVMLWYLGSQVEVRQGAMRFAVLFVACSLAGNLAQYLLSGPLFGGLSGVVYGLLGYVWWQMHRGARFIMPPALMVFAMVWLVLGLTPVPEWLMMSRMANGAHLGGLLAGLMVAVLMPEKKDPARRRGNEL